MKRKFRHIFGYFQRSDLVIFFIYILSFGIFLFFSLQNLGTAMSLIIQSSRVEYFYDISDAQILEFEGPIGRTVIEITEDGFARFIYSDCRDQICVKAGLLKESGAWAACLPNRIIARIDSKVDRQLDAATF